MTITVYSLVLYYGSTGDTVEVYASAAERDAAALDYAREHWEEECECERGHEHTCTPTLPETIEDAEARMSFGSCDARWLRAEHVLALPEQTP